MGVWGSLPLRTSGHSSQKVSGAFPLPAPASSSTWCLTSWLPAISPTGILCRSPCAPPVVLLGERLYKRSQAGPAAQGPILENTHPFPAMAETQLELGLPMSSFHSRQLLPQPWPSSSMGRNYTPYISWIPGADVQFFSSSPWGLLPLAWGDIKIPPCWLSLGIGCWWECLILEQLQRNPLSQLFLPLLSNAGIEHCTIS